MNKNFTFDLQRFADLSSLTTDDSGAYLITSVDDLNTLAAYVNDGTYGNDTTGLTFKQTADINLDGVDFHIGNYGKRFKGTYDGGNFTISNLTINSTDEYQGLFSYVDSAGTIKDVNLVNAKVSGYQRVGGLVGYNYGKIENCTMTGGEVSGTGDYVGGLVGYNYGTVSGIVTDSTISGKENVGGLVGWNYENAEVSGSSVNNSVSGNVYVGGLVGWNGGTASGITSDSTVTGTGNHVGGFVGLNSSSGTVTGSSVNNSVSSNKDVGVIYGEADTVNISPVATISANIDGNTVTLKYGGDAQGNGYYKISSVNDLKVLSAYVYAGNDTTGLTFKQTQDITFNETDGKFTPIGWYDYDSYKVYYFKGTFDGCNYKISNLKISGGGNDQGLFGGSSGTVRNVNLVNANVSGETYVGALVGTNHRGTVTNCTTTGGTISGTGNCIGGIVGENFYGTVSGSMVDGGSVTGQNNVGGIVGESYEGTVSGSMVDGVTVNGNGRVGGIVGYKYEGNFDNCLLDGGSVTGTNYVGSFVGYNDEGTATGYYHNINFTGAGTATEVYLLTLPDGVTASGNGVVSFAGKYYAEQSASITLSGLDNNHSLEDSFTGEAISNNTYVMPAQDSILSLVEATLHATISAVIDGQTVTLEYCVDEQNNPYYAISSVNDLKVLSDYVNNGHNCEGLTFKQTQDITFTEADGNFTPIGWYNYNNWTGYYFKGTFDGCNYKINNLKISGVGYNQGLFGCVDSSGTVRNVNLVNANVSGDKYVGGIVGDNYGTVTNCTTTGGTISGKDNVGALVGENDRGTVSGSMVDGVTVDGDKYVGGIVGYSYEGTVSGSMVDGVTVSGKNGVGGIVGYNSEGTVDNCLLDGGSVTGQNYVGSLVGGNGNNGTATGYYHNITFTGAGTATEVYLLTLPDGVTASGNGVVTDTGGNYYAIAGATVTLSGVNGSLKDTDGTAISDNTYVMPAQDSILSLVEATLHATISAVIDGQTVTLEYCVDEQNNPYYAISSVNDLKVLAAYVNASNDTTGLTFKQTQDITFQDSDGNFTPIGWYDYDYYKGYYFKGTFDGCNYKISNLKISGGGNDQGLFGDVDGSGTVRNVNLVNANVSGNEYVGALVGYNDGGTVENCTSTTGTVSGDKYVGALVGENYYGTVENCTSTTGTVSGNDRVGGIVGYNSGTVSDSMADGVTVSGNGNVGGIVGRNSYGTVSGSMAEGVTVDGDYNVGGIVGDNSYGTVSGSMVDGGSVTGTNYVGSFVGYNYDGTVKGYYHNINFTGEGTATEVFTITLPENVTASGGNPVTFGEKNYYKKDSTVTLAIDEEIQSNAVYAIADETYTVTKDEEVEPTLYISVSGGEYSNAVADISVIGGDGNEIIINNAEKVTLDGGGGNDSLVGSNNADVFVYSSGDDTVKGFSAVDDTIRLADGIVVSGNPQADDNGDVAINFAGGGKLIIEGAASLNTIDLYNADGTPTTYDISPAENIIFNNANPSKATSATVVSAHGDLGKQKANRTETYAKVVTITASQEDSTIVGNAKNNKIIVAGGSDNILTGGLGKDTYNFTEGGGIVTDFGIGTTKSGDGKKLATSTTNKTYDRTDSETYARGTDVVRVNGKVSGIYFERDGNTAKDLTFTAVITYNDGTDEQIVVLDNIAKKPTKTGTSPIYQTNDVAAKSLKIWDTSGNKHGTLSSTKLKKLFYDNGLLTTEQQNKVAELTALVEPKTDIITPVDSQTPSVGLRSTQIAFNSNSNSKN